MDRLRIAVIGLGWFGEIHCEAIVGIPHLELAALCTRTPDRLQALAKKFGVKKAYRRLPRTCWPIPTSTPSPSSPCGTSTPSPPSPRSGPASTSSSRSRWRPPSTIAGRSSPPSKTAKGILQVGHICRFNPRYRAAKQAIAEGRIGKIVSLASRRNIPAAWTPTILNKIGPIVGDAIHDTDLMLWFTGDRVVSAYAQTVDVRGLKHPDIGQTMYRFAGGATATLETVWCMPDKTPYDIDERMNIIGTEGFIQIQDTFPEPRHRRQGQVPQPRHDLLADVRGRARRGAPGGIRLFRRLRAEGRQAGDRHARGCHGGAAGDARRGRIGAHRTSRPDRGKRRLGGIAGEKRWRKGFWWSGSATWACRHALAYTRIPGVEVVGVCTRHIDKVKLPEALAKAKRYSNYDQALKELKPDIVSINTLPDTHADYAIKAMESGAHVFVEKPLAETVDSAERSSIRPGARAGSSSSAISSASIRRGSSSSRSRASSGTPLVFRMNLNQQSNGETWAWHKRLMDSFPPIVDCGVHYVDVMCQMTKAKPVRVQAMGAHLTDEVPVYNYGVLQVAFDDGSVGWYEAGWGPMMSETAFFVKDVIGPKGSVSIVMAENCRRREVGRHQRPCQDQPDPLASHRHVEAGRAHRHDRRARS